MMYEYPNSLVDLLLVLVDVETHPHIEEKEWKKVWSELQARSPAQLEKLENELARRSIHVR